MEHPFLNIGPIFYYWDVTFPEKEGILPFAFVALLVIALFLRKIGQKRLELADTPSDFGKEEFDILGLSKQIKSNPEKLPFTGKETAAAFKWILIIPVVLFLLALVSIIISGGHF